MPGERGRKSTQPAEGGRVLGVSGLLLAGGPSLRMGTNKALLVVRDRPMVEVAAKLLQSLFDEVLLSANAPEPYGFLGLRTVADRFPGCGPLAGIHAGLSAGSHSRALAVACDMPFLHAPLLKLISTVAPDAEVVVPRLGGELQPLCAVYARSCLEPIEEQLRSGDYKVANLFHRVRVREITPDELRAADPGATSLVNVNTPVELEAARRRAHSRG